MPNAYYSPKGQMAIAPPAESPIDVANKTQQAINNQGAAFDQQNKDSAAQAFQSHLDAGYPAMVSTLKELPPEVAAGIPSPEAYSDSEEKRAAWYMSVNDAVAKSNLLNQSQDPSASPDALNVAAARAPLSAESAKQVSGVINQVDSNQKGSQIQGLFQQPTPATGPAPTMPQVDPKTPIGRSLKIAMGRMAPHADTIQNAAASANVSPSVVMAVAAQESSGSAGATSSTGVKGTMQVTDGTFKDIASRHPEANLTDRTDPAQSYTAGALYIGELMQKFGGNTDQAFAAYNGGPSAVKAAVAKYPDDWQSHLEEFITPPKGWTPKRKADEIRGYVENVGGYLKALGGGGSTAAAKPVSQNDANMAALKVNPDLIVDPRFKEIKAGLKTDEQLANAAAGGSFKGQIQDRLMQKFRAEQDFKTYQKVNNYNKQIKDVAPGAQSIMRIDKLVGGLDSEGDIPGVGLGANTFEKYLMTDASPEAASMRLAINNLFSDIGIADAGKNFTLHEMENVKKKLGITSLSDVGTFRKAMRMQREKFFQKMQDPWNALPDDVKKDLYDAGTMNPEMFGNFKSDLVHPSTPSAQASAGGVAKLSPKQQAIIDKIKAERAAKAGG